MEKLEEQFGEQELSPEEKLGLFHEEIGDIKAGEMEKKKEWEAREKTGEAYNPHFDIIDPEFLSGAEMGIYERFKSGELNDEEFRALREEALSRFSGRNVETDPEYKSAHAFLMYLANTIHAQESRKQLDKLKGGK